MTNTCKHAAIQKRVAVIGLALLAFAIGLATAPVSALWLLDDHQMRVRHGDVYRQRWEFTIRAVYTPDLFTAGWSEHDIVHKANRVTATGANTLCFDLPGLSADGSTLDPNSVDFIREMMDLITWRRMSAIVRIFPPGANEDLAYRESVIDAIAREMRRETNMVYWVEGPNASHLARRLKAAAPRLCVAAPSGGDIRVGVEESSADGEGGTLERGVLLSRQESNQPEIVLGEAPAPFTDQAHFLLLDTPVDLARYDRLLMPEEETLAWEPDNSVLSDEERAEGFIALFDGKTTDGWMGVDGYAPAFKVEEGELRYIGRTADANDIRTTRRYSDFILRLEFRIGAGGNSGIFLRAPRTGRFSKIGMEFQILGDHGTAPNRNGTGSIYDVVAPSVNASRPHGEWNEVEITLNGPHGKAVLNGEVLWELDFDADPELAPRLREGFIALQDHDHDVAFRNVRLKEL